MVQFIKNIFKGSEMTHKNEETVVDTQMHHPFRCLVAGPSQSGKSTFVRNLLLWQNDIIDICFDYVTIILGTEANNNEILSSLKDELRPGVVEIIELKCKVLLPVSSLVVHKIYCVTLGNVARVYPWIVQGLMFLSA